AVQITRRGMVVGTPAYLAPELIEGERATTASDVFSWAATVAYAATGRPPFGRGSLHGVCFRILRGRADLDGVPEPLAGLLRLAFRRDPSRRPPARWLAGAPAGRDRAAAGRDAAAGGGRRVDRPVRVRGGGGWETMEGAVTSGERLGHSRLPETLGEGGRGVVYLGADSGGRNVAIKVLRP